MPTALHLIHPYVFKRRKDGKLETNKKFVQRDRQVSELVQTALNSDGMVIHHMDTPADSKLGEYRDNAFMINPLYSFLFSGKLIEVVTTEWGVPITDEKPKGTPQATWALYEATNIKHSELLRKMEGIDLHLLIGGALENCLGNMASYILDYYYFPPSAVKYIPNLCVSVDMNARRNRERELQQKGIEAITYERAVDILTTK